MIKEKFNQKLSFVTIQALDKINLREEIRNQYE